MCQQLKPLKFSTDVEENLELLVRKKEESVRQSLLKVVYIICKFDRFWTRCHVLR